MSAPVRFTFVLPVHNGMPYIRRQIQSILEQDYPHFNLVVLENASTDGTREFLETQKDPRVRICPADQFLSYDENWKRVSGVEKEKFLVCAMADDYYERNFLTEIVSLINRYPHANVYRTNVKIVYQTEENIQYPLQIPAEITFESYIRGRLLKTYFETFQGYCFKSDFFDKTWPTIPTNGGMASDEILVLSALADNVLPVSPCYACAYRLHGQNTSHTARVEKIQQGLQNLYGWILAQKNQKANKIIQKYLPYFLEHRNDLSAQMMLWYEKNIYPLFQVKAGRRLPLFHYMRKHFFLHKNGPVVRFRFGPLKIKKIRKKGF